MGGGPRPNWGSPIPRDTDPERGRGEPEVTEPASGLSPRPGPPAPTLSHLDRSGSGVQTHVGAGIQGGAHVSGQEVFSSLHGEKGESRDLEEPPV